VAQLRHALPPSAQTSVIADSSAGVGEAFAAAVACSSFAIESASIFASAASETPEASSRRRYSATGSRFSHSSSSSLGRYFAGSAREWPLWREVRHSISDGPPPPLAFSIAARAVLY